MASPIASAALKARVRRPTMLNKLCRPQDMLHHFPNGAYIGWSGFTGVGYPKFVFLSSAIMTLADWSSQEDAYLLGRPR